MEQILEYLKTTYSPLAIVTYGSYQDGTNDTCSDYDCMVIVNEKSRKHDDSVIGGVQLDCYIFTAQETVAEEADLFLTVYNGTIVFDTDEIAANLKSRVMQYVQDHSKTDPEKKQFIASWIVKTMHRVEKNDDEGNFRALAFLWESITDYFLLRDMFYFGSKKAVAYLKANDPEGYDRYHRAITERTNAAIAQWAEHVIAYPAMKSSEISVSWNE